MNNKVVRRISAGILSLLLVCSFVLGTSVDVDAQGDTYKLVFDGNGSTGGQTASIDGIKANKEIIIPECGYTKDGYTFADWNTKADGTGMPFSANTKIPANLSNVFISLVDHNEQNEMTLFARWWDNSKNWSIVFDGNGASSGNMDSITNLNYNSQVTVPECGFTKDGYTFIGYECEIGSGYSHRTSYYKPGDKVSLSNSFYQETATLKAVWWDDNEDVVVYFGGSEATSGYTPSITTKINSNITLPQCGFKKDGYSFAGWTIRGHVYYNSGYNQPGDNVKVLDVVAADLASFQVGHFPYINAVWSKNKTPAPQPSNQNTNTNTKPASQSTQTDTGVSMYRLYNPNSGEHFYTANAGEMQYLSAIGWRYEGIGWTAPSTGTPVYRMYNPNVGDHHYTMNWAEVQMLKNAGWNYEGEAWKSGGSVKMLRAYNPNAVTGTHHYTSNPAELRSIVAVGWRDEGYGWYALR